MPEKFDLIKVMAKTLSAYLCVFFSGSVIHLQNFAQNADCSKQTVLRLLDNIRKSYGVNNEETKEGNRNFYRIRKPASPKNISVRGGIAFFVNMQIIHATSYRKSRGGSHAGDSKKQLCRWTAYRRMPFYRFSSRHH